MKNRRLSWLAVSVLAILITSMVALIFAGCAKSTPTTPAPTTPTPATPQPPEVTAIQLRFATNLPPVSAQVKLYEEWIQKMEEATEGSVKIDIYPAESLIQGTDMVSGVKSGLTDIGEINVLQSTDQFPLTSVLLLPFLPAIVRFLLICLSRRQASPRLDKQIRRNRTMAGRKGIGV